MKTSNQHAGEKPGATGKSRGSTPRLSAADVAPLHSALMDSFPSLRTGLSAVEMASDREIAFSSSSADDFKYWYLESQALKRYVGTSNVDANVRKNAAIGKLRASEDECYKINGRLVGALDDCALTPLDIKRVLKKARGIISRILGSFPWEEFPRACNFGPGATLELTRARSSIQNKWSEADHITAKALPYHHAFVRWAGLDGLVSTVTVVSANKVFTVPKNFETDRVACMEPGLNTFYQKGLGALTRKRLRNVEKLLLPDAQEYHQVLAKLGSACGALATIDLVGASDHITCGLVSELVRADWARHYFALRSPEGVLPDGSTVVWEKISTMGNGFTFELETLLFYSIVRAVCGNESLVSVYGDDIVCPTRFARRVAEVLDFCGFKTNSEKSFLDGPFRESCGGHYWKGIDVKPFYLQRLPTQIDEVINLHNDVIRWSAGGPVLPRFLNVLHQCRKLVPRSYWGPYGLLGVLWASWDDCRPKYRPAKQAFTVKSVTRKMYDQKHDYYIGGYLAQLWVIPNDDDAHEFSKLSFTGSACVTTTRYVCRTQWKQLPVNMS